MKNIIIFVCYLFVLNLNAQISKNYNLEFSKNNLTLISQTILIDEVDDNPYISLSIFLESEEIDKKIKKVYYLDSANNWIAIESDHELENSNLFINHIDLLRTQKQTRIKIVVDNDFIFSKSFVRLYYPMDTAFLLKENKENYKNVTTNCNCPRPTTQTRSQWCPSNNCTPNPNPIPTNVKFLIVHHTATPNSDTDWAARVRQIWDYHVNTRGWSDIGYNFLIDPNGIIYDAREDDTKGAHFSGHNSETSGISLLGTYTSLSPSTAMQNSLKEFLAWKACDRSIDVLATVYHSSSSLNLHTVAGHRDSGSGTVCPGNTVYNLLPNFRTATNTIMNNCSTASIGNNELTDKISIYPNPTKDKITLKIDDTIEVKTIEIYSVIGLLIKKYSVANKEKLDVQDLESGTYLLKIETKNHQKIIFKLVKV